MTALFTFSPDLQDIAPVTETINIIRGDAYDDVANPMFSWTANQDVTGLNATLTLREIGDNDISPGPEVLSVTTVGVGNQLSFTLTSSDTNIPSPFISARTNNFNFDVELQCSSGQYNTLVLGTAVVTVVETRR